MPQKYSPFAFFLFFVDEISHLSFIVVMLLLLLSLRFSAKCFQVYHSGAWMGEWTRLAFYIPVYCNFFFQVGRSRKYSILSFTPVIYNHMITREAPFGIYCVLQLNHKRITAVQSNRHLAVDIFCAWHKKKKSGNVKKINKPCKSLNVSRSNLTEH